MESDTSTEPKCRYGIVTRTDALAIERSLTQCSPTRLFEIGVHAGATARGIRAFLMNECGVFEFDYLGVDSERDMPIAPPFPGARMLYGDSSEIYGRVGDGFDWGFIDGCHCINHVTLDVLHWGAKIVPGGHLVLHDTGATAQGAASSYQMHGPDTPDFCIAVRAALSKLGIFERGAAGPGHYLHPLWRVVDEVDEGRDFGGVTVLERK